MTPQWSTGMAEHDTSVGLNSPWAGMWQNPDADATVLLSMLVGKYGEEALDWDPFTVFLEIRDDYHVSPADAVMNKICAMQIVMSSSDFFERIDTFTNVCNSLSEGDPFFKVFTPLGTEEIAFALATVAMNRDMLPFSNTIRRYVKKVLKADGFDSDEFPDVFSVVFDKAPSSKDVRHDVAMSILNKEDSTGAAGSNGRNIAKMLAENVGIMFRQFNSLPGLRHMDDHILENGVMLSLNGKAPEQDGGR